MIASSRFQVLTLLISLCLLNGCAASHTQDAVITPTNDTQANADITDNGHSIAPSDGGTPMDANAMSTPDEAFEATERLVQMPENAQDAFNDQEKGDQPTDKLATAPEELIPPSQDDDAELAENTSEPSKDTLPAKPRVPVLPKNTRQVDEGYWVGSLPEYWNIDALKEKKIKLIITATRLSPEMKIVNEHIDELKIKHLILPFGSKFPKTSRFYQTVLKYSPDETYIHCDHGGDRTGVFLAYLLVARHGWTLPRALLAVLYPSPSDIKGLTEILNKRGYTVEQADIDQYVGIYSATKNGGGGGLKVRNADYKKLVNTMIDKLEASKH